VIDNQNPNQNTQNNETEKDCLQNNTEQIKNTPNENFTNHINREKKTSIDKTPNYKPPIARYYSKNLGQITIKADKELVDAIKQIAKDEERTIQTVTNRMLETALDLYEKNRDKYLR
jgi:hypothetical protein